MSIKRIRAEENTTGVLYKDDNVTISQSHMSAKPFEQLIQHVGWIKKGNHRWNLWTIASYAGVFDFEEKWPLFSHISVCYEDRVGESVVCGGKHQWIGYNVQSDVYNIDYVISIHVILK
jgi:hypothetical protein